MARLAMALGLLCSAVGSAQPTLSFSTYLGGNEFDSANAVAVDAQGFIYAAGQTFSRNFPARGAVQEACVIGPLGSCSDAFVAKIDPAASRVVWATFLGRSFSDTARAIAVGPDGTVAVTGHMDQSVFVARFYADGTLIYLQHFGRFAVNIGQAIALDADGNAYVAGQTMDPGFPVTAGAFQRSAGPPSCSPIGGGSLLLDAFVMKLSPSGSVLYSTFLGGNGNDRALGIAVDAAGGAWVTGTTSSTDFPVTGGLQGAYAGGDPQGAGICEGGDAFLARLGADGSTIGFSTYLGGAGADIAEGIALDSSGQVYVTGSTGGLPGFDLHPGGFTAKVDTAIPRIVYAISGGGTALALDRAGNAYAAGNGAAVVRIDPAGGRSLYYSANLRGVLHALALDGEGNLYLAGDARDSLPVAHAIQAASAGNADAFVLMLTAPGPRLFSADGSFQGPAAAVAVHIKPDGDRWTELTFSCPSPGDCRNVPIDTGPEGEQVVLLLFGTGLWDARSGVSARIGGIDAEVTGLAAQPEYSGLDQMNVRLPRRLAGRGVVEVQAVIDGRPANIVTVAVR